MLSARTPAFTESTKAAIVTGKECNEKSKDFTETIKDVNAKQQEVNAKQIYVIVAVILFSEIKLHFKQ